MNCETIIDLDLQTIESSLGVNFSVSPLRTNWVLVWVGHLEGLGTKGLEPGLDNYESGLLTLMS